MKGLSRTKTNIGILILSLILIYAFISIINNPPNYDSKDLIELEEEFPVLMSAIVKGLRLPDDSESRVRPNGYTYLTYYYNLPKDEEISLIKNNIDAVSYWQVIPTRIRDDKNIFMSYCFKDIALNLSRYDFQESSDKPTFERLMITIYYYKNSDCVSGTLKNQSIKSNV